MAPNKPPPGTTVPSTGGAAGGGIPPSYGRLAEILATFGRDGLAPAEKGGQETPKEEAVGGGKKRKPSGRTSLDRIPGRRPMKEFPVTSRELWTLGSIQAASA